MTRLHATWHRDGTVTYWAVHRQAWVRRASVVPDVELAAWPERERARWIARRDGARWFTRRDGARGNARELLGVVFYAGASALDGAPIVGILTLRESANRKTGNMAQAWIIAQDVDPVDAQRTGADASVCGSCILRPALVRLARERGNVAPRCYVNAGQAPLAVWRAWTRGAYARADAIDPARLRAALGGRAIRWGAYGDPAAIPQHAWLDLHTRCGAPDHTAYTHAWRDSRAAWLRAWAMASADDAQGLRDARAAGWRAFRVRKASDPLAEREIACPAESGRAQCADCTLCDGARGADDRRASIAIVAHGAGTPAEWLAGGDA